MASVGGQFCVGCGQPLHALASTATAVSTRERARPPARGSWLAFQEIRLLACPQCGAPNSAARWQCARCGTTFEDRAPDTPATGEVTPQPTAAPEPVPTQSDGAPWVLLITAVVCVAAVAVAVVMLASRGQLPFGSTEPATAVTQATQAPIVGVRASGAASDGPRVNINDGDPGTAWRTDGDGEGAWIELRLAEPAQIDHLLVWNGDQSDDGTFDATDRARDLTISFPDVKRTFVTELHSYRAALRVDMEDPPLAQVVRIRIDSVEGGAGQAALSEVEVLVDADDTVAGAP